jgi:hypothetical protein
VWDGSGAYSGAQSNFVAAYKTLSAAINADDRAAADAAMKKLTVANLCEDAYFGMTLRS